MHIGWEHAIPVDLKTRKYTDTSCQIEIHFSIQIIKYDKIFFTLFVNRLYRLIIFFKTVTKFQPVSQKKTKDISDSIW